MLLELIIDFESFFVIDFMRRVFFIVLGIVVQFYYFVVMIWLW